MCSPHFLEFADRITAVLVNGFGVFLQNARSGMADHLRDEEIGYAGRAQTTCVRVTKTVQPKIFQSCIFQRLGPSVPNVA